MIRALAAITCSAALGAAALVLSLQAASPVHYHVSVPEPQHRWMQVEATFPDLGETPLELRMSRSSPGRYSSHDFAKNVYDVHVFGADGRELQASRPDPYGWTVSGHGGRATVKYRVYGDRVDGTYLAIDPTHAHINMPAAMMWAHGLEERPIAIDFDQPPGAGWRIVTQLHGPAGDRSAYSASGPVPTFTAPNLQYFMDSPVEFGRTDTREFTVDGSRFRVALHQAGSEIDLDAFTREVQKVVREEGAIYGEFPRYEPGVYTFIADYLPWADGDGMEHRNSTIITMPARSGHRGADLIGTVAHEFFHGWNVERIRPRGLEPFDFDRANFSGELWLAEGFTQYYGPLALQRAGLMDLQGTARTLTSLVDSIVPSSARAVRSAEQMSQMAPFIDGGRTVDRTNWSTTIVSYYPFGGAIALALDLSLRDRTDNRVSLDDFMRAMWRKYGKPGGGREGYVDRPYTIDDAQTTLAEVAGDAAFAHEFFARYVQGHDVADYAHLLARAGFVLRKRNPGHAWLGDVRLEPHSNGTRIAALVAPNWPIYAAGIDQDDQLQTVDGQKISGDADLAAVLARHKPGDAVPIAFVDRTGSTKSSTIRLAEDPDVEVVLAETVGTLTPAAQAFRDRWLKSRS